ncbi:MAG: CDP-alcohol phosphatidyltransferase family protein [Pseudomonadota bacterium]
MFAGAAFVGAFGVVAAALFLPNAPVFPVSLAVMFYAVSATVAGWAMYRSYPHNRVGWCNYLTLIRLVLVSALLVPLISGSAPSWAFFAVAAVALSVDGLDGWFARREGLASEFGARFDVEVDSLLALVLALNAAFNTDVGLWVVLFGLPRYAFGLAGMALPWMRGDLPERFSRKVVCVLQLATLIALQAPILPQVLIVMLVPVVALALIWSFALDILWLWRSRR